MRRSVGVYGLAFGYLGLTAYFLGHVMPWWAAILLAPIAIQVPIYIVGLCFLPRWRNNLAVHTWMMIALLIGAALWVWAC